MDFLSNWKIDQKKQGKLFFDCRIGIHTGPVIAGVVGEKKFAFDIWGDSVNTVEKVETSGEVGKINISQTTFSLVRERYSFPHRGKIPIKNMEPLDMYFVDIY